MAYIKNFIDSKNIETIEEFETIIQDEPYYLKLKHFKNNELMIVVHQENTNLEEEICLHMHGLIIDKYLNIIRYNGKKAIEDENNTELMINDKINMENAVITPVIDGTFISVYKYEGKLYYSTKKALEARMSKWHSDKSFEQLFIEAIGGVEFSVNIHDNFMYNFILCSKENSNIVSYDDSHVVLLSVYEFNSCINVPVEHFQDLLTNPRVKYIQNMGIHYDLMKQFYEENDIEKLKYLGIYITDFENSQKFYFSNYIKLKNILPNNHDFLYTYLTLRKNQYMLEMYLKNHGDKKEQFKSWETMISTFISITHDFYVQKRIHKKEVEIPEFLKTTLYKIHGIHLTTRSPITYNVIFNHLNILHEKQLYVLLKKFQQYILHGSTSKISIEQTKDEEMAELESYSMS